MLLLLFLFFGQVSFIPSVLEKEKENTTLLRIGNSIPRDQVFYSFCGIGKHNVILRLDKKKQML